MKPLLHNITCYLRKKDITDELNPAQLNELNTAIAEADNKDTIPWEDFKKEMNEWKTHC